METEIDELVYQLYNLNPDEIKNIIREQKLDATMNRTNCTHIAFADESNWNEGRFRSIALVSAKVDDARKLHTEIREIVGGKESKWSVPNRELMQKLVDFSFPNFDKMRVDTIIWDMEDSRHKGIIGRDDRANFARMYYHLLHNVLKKRWNAKDACWRICPDKNDAVDWNTLEQCLDWKGWAREENLFTAESGNLDFCRFYEIIKMEPVKSEEFKVVQLADLFAGLGAYSYREFAKYEKWKNKKTMEEGRKLNQQFDFTGSNNREEPQSNRRDRARLHILDYIREEAGKRKLQISLKSTQGLKTNNPQNPLNFWFYEPQRKKDKAPIKTIKKTSSI